MTRLPPTTDQTKVGRGGGNPNTCLFPTANQTKPKTRNQTERARVTLALPSWPKYNEREAVQKQQQQQQQQVWRNPPPPPPPARHTTYVSSCPFSNQHLPKHQRFLDRDVPFLAEEIPFYLPPFRRPTYR